MTTTMRQYAPYPQALEDIVLKLKYRPGWTFRLEDIERDPEDTHGASAGGLTLVVTSGTWDQGGRGVPFSYIGAMDAYHPNQPRPVHFYIEVPAATYNEQAWTRWVFDELVKIELHETMEYFQVGDARPFSPVHAPGFNPSTVVQTASEVDKRTSFRGVVKNPDWDVI